MPAHDLATLITLNIAMTMTGILGAMISVWAIMREMGRNAHAITEHTRDISQIQREVAFMIRRQYGDIDRDLQEIKELLRGQ